MLERTAGCLETGRLRRLLPASKTSVKSRRTLHSGFWNHGAGDLELNPLWAVIVRGADSVGQQEEACPQSNPSSALLDFLYPAGTLNFIRRNAYLSADKQEGRWVRPWSGRAARRGYTSSAKTMEDTHNVSEAKAVEEADIAISMMEDIGVLYEKFGLQKDIDFEEAWRQYTLLETADQVPLRKLMMRYLTKSERIVDAERVTGLFEALSRHQQDGSTYQQAVRSYLKLRNLADAMRSYTSAVDSLQIPAGAEDILEYHLGNQSWSRAFSFWQSVQEVCSRSQTAADYDIYKNIELLPKLSSQALDLAKFVDKIVEQTSVVPEALPNLLLSNQAEQKTNVDLESLSNAEEKSPKSADNDSWATSENSFSLAEARSEMAHPRVVPGSDTAKLARSENTSDVHVPQDSGTVHGAAYAGTADDLSAQRKPVELHSRQTIESRALMAAEVDQGSSSGAKARAGPAGASVKVSRSPGATPTFPKKQSKQASSREIISQEPSHPMIYAVDLLAMHSDLIRFASEIVKRAMFGSKAFDGALFVQLLQHLHKWQMAVPQVYERAIELLAGFRNEDFVVTCYDMARRSKGFTMNRRTLHKVLETFCANHDFNGMKKVLDDFFALHNGPTRIAYRMCLREFSRQGDADTVHALFEQYSARFLHETRHSSVETADEFVPVLHVHARRGEVEEVKRIFEQIEVVYGMQPSIRCWNILLNAQSKVHDYDGAFTCFQKLLNDPNVHPDSYTIGTIMGMCAVHGDADRTKDMFELAQQMGIQQTMPMINALVLAYIHEGMVDEATQLAEETTARKDIKGSRTRMWNCILQEHAIRRDLESVNGIIQRMAQLDIEPNEYTYAMLMQALAMVGQPREAWKILRTVMPEAGIKPTRMHYAIIMGGYIFTREYHQVIKIQETMRLAGFPVSPSSSHLAMKALASIDTKLYGGGPVEQQVRRALAAFASTVTSGNTQDLIQRPVKGDGAQPIHIAYPTMFYNYIVYILASRGDFAAATDAYDAYRAFIPADQRDPVSIITALMTISMQKKEHDKVEELYKLAFSKALDEGRRLEPKTTQQTAATADVAVKGNVLPKYQLILHRAIRIYMQSLTEQQRARDLTAAVRELIDAGFLLDNRNWNTYISYLARRGNSPKDAFSLCESQLMPRWTGWTQLRQEAPVRNRLPLSIRRKKFQGRYTRPFVSTLLCLSRAFLDLQAVAADDTRTQAVLNDIERECPLTVKAIKTKPRLGTALERAILDGD